jgi:hypothetical protein
MHAVIESQWSIVGLLPWSSGRNSKGKKLLNHHKGRGGRMKGSSIVSIALVALVGSAVGLCTAESETFAGTATVSGTYKRPQLLVDGKRYELKTSDRADASVAEVPVRFSKVDTGTYVVKGTQGTVIGVDGIHIDSITPAKADPGTGAPAAAKRPGYKVYDYVVKATPPAMGKHKFRLVVPHGLAVVRGILVVGPYAGGDSRDYHEQVWYREFLNLHGFAFLGAKDFYMHDYKVMQAALKQLAIDTKHPELVNAPYAATGFSAGGGYTAADEGGPGQGDRGGRRGIDDEAPRRTHGRPPACADVCHQRRPGARAGRGRRHGKGP